jgi:uncharacterized protein (TIGR03085 family)
MADAVNYARTERAALCDLLTDLGPDQPTLCAGWTTRDLAAHLVIRERRPDAALGLMARPLAGHTAKVQAGVAAKPFAEVVAMVRRPPGWSPLSGPGPVDRAINTTEFFVHHEDVRRAQPGWEPRTLQADFEAVLWNRVGQALRLTRRRLPVPVTLVSPGYGEVGAGDGDRRVRVTGPPGELVLFMTGRQAASRVELSGPDEMVERLTTAKLGL